MKSPVVDTLARYGLTDRFPPDRFAPTVGAAVDEVTGTLRGDISGTKWDAAPESRRRDPGDRRAWQLFLTPNAEPMVAELRAIAAGLASDAFDGLSGANCDAVRNALATVRANLSALTEQSLSA